ncbi:MAG: ABC transporter ATP-binding protein [Alphaproteobacteria bacterium]
MTALKAIDISVHFDTLAAVDKVSFEAAPGALIGLIGPNGAGKTSLVRALANLVPYEGRVELDGQQLGDLSRRELARTIAYLAQAQPVHWPLTVRQLTALGRLPYRAPFQRRGFGDDASIERAMSLAAVTELADRKVDALSGGERARSLLARALAVEAPVLLVDEPVAALDPYHQLEIMEVLRAYAEAGALVIAVLHDLVLAERFCHRLLLMRGGALLADDAPDVVLTDSNLQAAYRVAAAHGTHEGQRYTLPWRRIDG